MTARVAYPADSGSPRPLTVGLGCAIAALLFVVGFMLILLCGGALAWWVSDGGPSPFPSPSPFTEPDAEVAFVVALEESGERDAATARLLASRAWAELIEPGGVEALILDDDQPAAADYVSVVRERPGIVLLSSDGDVIHAGPLPDADGLEVLLGGRR